MPVSFLATFFCSVQIIATISKYPLEDTNTVQRHTAVLLAAVAHSMLTTEACVHCTVTLFGWLYRRSPLGFEP